ncbi:MAG: universal stress protein [Armatimonadetes bacterium]|nr:universal stress protein [Armatimonadota bacterium]
MFSKILCPVDGSETSLKAAHLAAQLAGVHQARLTLLYVVPVPVVELLRYRPTMMEDDLVSTEHLERRLEAQADEVLNRTREDIGAEAELVRIMGHPGEVICLQSRDFDVVVMGSRGRGALKSLLLGSVCAHVISHCTVPVLIVR